MLENIPGALGRALRPLRAGENGLSLYDEAAAGAPGGLEIGSPAFGDHEAIPARFTADGEGTSPPLRWGAPPAGTVELAILVEDADSPTPNPLVHAIVRALPPAAGELPAGALDRDGAGAPATGRNSYLSGCWLPPDPPTGHGAHRYVFQVFALSAPLEHGDTPGRGAVLGAMRGKVLATGHMTGTYERR